ncbi:NACHT domain-containing protein [Phytohabitans houttuyneae]|uniref:ATP-binding protein n=1 Tax=Phytohabitans houttuyneae TaxID=1076126 RepID=A0A6V8KDT3_9ACTN|nr:NACHT domain-containing protein [Phytohabitans houttuyneae]GFJ81954.1 ATP-binding protein [Phytohabitans houttuyneae]
MSGLEIAALALGKAVAKAACGVWFGDHKVASDLSSNAIDLVAERLTSVREQRRFIRAWDEAADIVADRVQPLVVLEFRDLSLNEQVAAVEAVRETVQNARLTDDDLFRQDLDAGYLDRYLRSQDADRARRAGLAEGAVNLYNLLLRECCAYVIEVARTLPSSGVAGLAELLRRDRQILNELSTVLALLPDRRGVDDFERDYRQLVANRLDRVEFFGATLSEASRRYTLSVAYLSLTVAAASKRSGLQRDSLGTPRPVEEVLGSSRRLFIRGQAGTGKTTLLQWIAVQSARSGFPLQMPGWNGTVPFFVPLRRYIDTDLPAPEAFLREVGRHIVDDMPAGWVQAQLRSGRAVILVDGLDELPEKRRQDMREWLAQLTSSFPDARYVLTSRPAAAPEDWLDNDDFTVAELEPMTRYQIPEFIHRWHEAMRSASRTDQDRQRATTYENHLLGALDKHRHLRQLAGSPLLCALLCALHQDRRGQLPANRMELYEVALHMLLERRDHEHGIAPSIVLSRTDKTLLLRDLAYRLIRNEWSDADRDYVIAMLEAKLAAMPQVKASPEIVYQVLLERSGLVREQVEGRMDFIHRSFQEYLAGQQATVEADYGVLAANAHLPQWHEVVVMAAGHASPTGRGILLQDLLRRSDKHDTSPKDRDILRLVALGCLETSAEQPPALAKAIRAAAKSLIPPRSAAAALALSRAGPFALDLLMDATPQTETEVALTISAAVQTTDPAALPLLATFAADSRPKVVDALLRAWQHFDPHEYAFNVLRESPLIGGAVQITDPRQVDALHHLGRLTDLRLARIPDVDLTFVHGLPNLRRLSVEDPRTLHPLAGQPLVSLTVSRTEVPIDLAPLASMPRLTEFRAFTRVWNEQSIAGLPLAELGLDAAAFCRLTCDWPALKKLELIGAHDLTELPVANLAQLTHLTLEILAPLDLSPIAQLPALDNLRLNVKAEAPDLTALQDTHISSIEYTSDSIDRVDLRPLAFHREVKVRVPRGTTVLGASQSGGNISVVHK